MKNALLLLSISALIASGSAVAQPSPGFAISCSDTGKNSKQCQVKNTGLNDMAVCMDVVKVCSDGDHVADFCSGQIAPGNIETLVVKNFVPKVRLLVACQGTEFRNKEFQRVR